MARTGYRWWIDRMRRVLALVDVFRIDHFRGFAGYWTVPAGAETARDGWWSPGPGAALFRAAEAELGPLPVIAEDLGVITPDVHALRDELGFPGMVVLLWSFSGPPDNPHRLENHRENQVVYTSTHDTDTLAGFTGQRDVWPLIERALSSRSALAIVPVQDVLGLSSEARMNRPGVIGGGNWEWRLEPGELTHAHAARLRAAAEASARALEEDLQRGVGRAAALEERDGEVQVDVAVEREHERGLGVVPRPEQPLDAPRGHAVALAFGPGGSDRGLNCHRTGENARHVWRPSSRVSEAFRRCCAHVAVDRRFAPIHH